MFLGATVPAAPAGPRVLAGAASGANDALVTKKHRKPWVLPT